MCCIVCNVLYVIYCTSQSHAAVCVVSSRKKLPIEKSEFFTRHLYFEAISLHKRFFPFFTAAGWPIDIMMESKKKCYPPTCTHTEKHRFVDLVQAVFP